jgi:hypothetical protein
MFCRCSWLLIVTIWAVSSWAEAPARPDLNGSWRLDPALSEVHTHVTGDLTWQIEQDDNSIHLIQRAQEKKADDIRCATDGHDCKIKDEGHNAIVSFYYNGPVLVELESEGQNRDTVIKKRMQVSSDGSKLTVEVIYVVPTGRQPEKLVLTRQGGTGSH